MFVVDRQAAAKTACMDVKPGPKVWPFRYSLLGLAVGPVGGKRRAVGEERKCVPLEGFERGYLNHYSDTLPPHLDAIYRCSREGG